MEEQTLQKLKVLARGQISPLIRMRVELDQRRKKLGEMQAEIDIEQKAYDKLREQEAVEFASFMDLLKLADIPLRASDSIPRAVDVLKVTLSSRAENPFCNSLMSDILEELKPKDENDGAG